MMKDPRGSGWDSAVQGGMHLGRVGVSSVLGSASTVDPCEWAGRPVMGQEPQRVHAQELPLKGQICLCVSQPLEPLHRGSLQAAPDATTVYLSDSPSLWTWIVLLKYLIK